MTILHIENRNDIVKHKESAAILSADLNAYQLHINKRKLQLSSSERIKSLESRVAHLEQAINALLNK
jgi:hypothetical protein